MKDGRFLCLGIESSCDETSAAVVADGRVILSDIIASQIDIHRAFGGVVPEIASRHHLSNINGVIEAALNDAGAGFGDIDLIGVTKGPGLVGAILIGLATAKAMALTLDRPLIGVHHIRGHVLAALLQDRELEPPFLSLIVSGGHTDLIDVRGAGDMRLLGRTRDDAAGEAYDKVARVLGLGYPGGPEIDRISEAGDPDAVVFKRVMLEDGSLDFSFSGIKTGVLNYVNSERQAGREIVTADVAAGFQASVIDVLATKTQAALELTGHRILALGGGVASNRRLRRRMESMCGELGVRLCLPDPELCTDNAAMIACAATLDFHAGARDGLDLDACARLDL